MIMGIFYLIFIYVTSPFNYNFCFDSYDDINTEKLRQAVKENEVEGNMFYFDPKIIDWDDYFQHTHLPGAVKYVFN